MELTSKEKEILKYLTEQELKQISEEEDSIVEQRVGFLAMEQKYEEALKALITKLD